MKDSFLQHLYIFYTGILLLYIVNLFWQQNWLAYTVGLLAIPMLIISFFGASKLFRILGTVFISTGLLMYIITDHSINNIPLLLTSNMSMLAFLTVLPWINSVVHVGKYDDQINGLLQENVSNLGSLYKRSLITTYILMTFLNLSAINLSQGVLIANMKSVKKTVRDVLISKTTIRAFALALIWSPMEIIVAITVDATGVSYLVYLPWLILVSVIATGIDLYIGNKRFKEMPYDRHEHNDRDINVLPLKEIIVQIAKLLIALILFLTTILVVSNLFDLNFILAVTLVILPFSIIWAIIIKRWNQFKVLGFQMWKEQTNRMQNFVILFISLALFTNSLNETPILNYVQGPFVMYKDYPIIILSLILVTYFVMAMIGVHPIGTIAILLEVLTPLFAIFNPVSIGIVLIVAALATSSSGTYGITVTMTSMNTNQNPYRISLMNLPFTLLLGAIGIGVAMIII